MSWLKKSFFGVPLLHLWSHQDANNSFQERVVILELQEVMDQNTAKWKKQAKYECKRPLRPQIF